MSDASEKPFEATAGRLRKARREGNVARSSELAANLAFAAGALTVSAIAPIQADAGASAVSAAATSGTVELNDGVAWVRAAVIVALALLPAGLAALAGAVGGLAQNGGLTAVAIVPKFERLNPVEGIKRIVSRDTLAHSLRAALAFGCATAAVSPFVAWSAVALLQAPAIAGVTAVTWRAVEQVAFAACAVGCCFALAEYGAARNAWLRKLRMSFDERKRESREEEGDAVARGRRRALHRTLLRGGMRRVKDAAFVVVNPRHVAVALEYRPPRIPVPRVLVRAADAAAIRVRAIALECRIPIVENLSLARMLYRDARAGEAIPAAHYVAVAEVVAALLRSGQIAQS